MPLMEPPVKPQESDCCNSGCNPCILDVYESQLQKYYKFCKENSSISKINALDPLNYTLFTLSARKQICDDVFLLTFTYSDNRTKISNCLQYNPGQYLLLKGRDTQGEFTRAYTPIRSTNLSFVILVKIYKMGRMSLLLNCLEIGSETMWRGPYGDFSITHNKKFLFLIAQGTGIAPLFTLINDLVHNEDYEAFIKLYFCCRNCDSILLREELYELMGFWNFSYEIFLSDSTGITRKYSEVINEKKLTIENLNSYVNGKKKEDIQVLICGSEQFSENFKCIFEKLGFINSDIYLF